MIGFWIIKRMGLHFCLLQFLVLWLEWTDFWLVWWLDEISLAMCLDTIVFLGLMREW